MAFIRVRRLPILATLVAAAALVLAGLVPASAGATSLDDIVVHLNDSTRLRDNQLVRAVANGLPADTTFDVRLCDALRTDNGFGSGCAPIGSVTSNADGHAVTHVRLPAYQLNDDQYEGYPVYCRSDQCHLYFSITDEDGNQHGASSRALEFRGSPATVQASPNTNLPKRKQVEISGTAFGAEGRTVLVGEHACVHRPTGGSYCAGHKKYKKIKVDRTGHFATSYYVRRYVKFVEGGRYDCNAGFYSCTVTAVILKANGQPDNSFGESEYHADPAGYLEFRD